MTESEMLSKLDNSQNILLIEPSYHSDYLPLGLMKIASYLLAQNKKVTFGRKVIVGNFDLVCITTLFTYQAPIVLKTIKQLKSSVFTCNSDFLIGGILATIMPKYIQTKTGIDPFTGWSKVLDQTIPDYSLDYYKSDLWNKYSTVFTSRGCCNKCDYCAVKKLEPNYWINPTWKNHIINSKPKVKIGDNNLLATPKKHLHDVLTHLAKTKKEVMFDGGLYAKLITDENAKLLSKVTIDKARRGIRTAFDRKEDDGYFQRGMERLIKYGINPQHILVYILINFEDTPQESYYRLKECAKFKSGSSGMYGYVMRYKPLDSLDIKSKNYISPFWTKNILKAFTFYSHSFSYLNNSFEDWIKKGRYDKQIIADDWDKWYYKR